MPGSAGTVTATGSSDAAAMPGSAGTVAATGSSDAAAMYDSWFESPWGQYASKVEADLIANALEPVPGARILDAGCGTGRFGESLAEFGAKVTGVDLDSSMLALAQRRLGCVALADVHHLPFAGGAFDATLAVTLCEFASDPEAVLEELARVTRSGGRIVIGLLNKRSPWGWLRRRRLSRKPWSDAAFINPKKFMAAAGQYGEASLTAGLFSAGVALPGFISLMVEAAGRRLLPGKGAFQVIAVARR